MPLTLKKRGKTYWVRGTVRGISCYETTGTTEKALAEEYRAQREAELYRQAIHGQKATVSFQRAALSYLEAEERSLAQKSYVAKLVEHFSSIKVNDIEQAQADAAVAAILQPGAAAATKRRNVLGPLIAILHHAARRKWCSHPEFELPSVPKARVDWMTPQQYLALEQKSADHLRPMNRFRVCCGARLGEALVLDWRQVDLAAGHAIFLADETKNEKQRRALLPPAAIEALASLPHRKGRVFLRPGPGGKGAPMEPYADTGGRWGGQIKTAWNGACRRAGLGDKVEKDGKNTFKKWFTPHDLRDTWATWFYALSKDPILLRDEGSWSDLAMVEVYAHLMPSELVPEISLIWGGSHPRIGELPAPAVDEEEAEGDERVTA
jgi:integrase